MSMIALRDRAAALEALPLLESVQRDLRAALATERTSLKTLAAMVSHDPVLTVRMLSLLYARHPEMRGQLPSLSKTVAMLGFDAVRLSCSGAPLAITIDSRDDAPIDLRALWGHSLAVAVAARAIAETIGGVESEACFTAGLLHDLGKLVLYVLDADQFAHITSLSTQSARSFYACEIASESISHAVLGRLVADHWGFPMRLVEAIGWHHTPQLATTNARFVQVIHLADALAHALDLGWSGSPYMPALYPSVPGTLGLRLHQVDALMRRIEAEFPAAAATIGLSAEDLYGALSPHRLASVQQEAAS